MSAQRKLTEAKAALLLNHPFFASLLLDMMQIEVGKFPEIFQGATPTMATNGRKIWVDEDFIQTLKVSESVFVLCHEIGHAMWAHMPRGKLYLDMGFDGKQFSPYLWNVAGDYVINDMLIQAKVGKMPKIGLHNEDYPYTMVVDEVYRALLKEDQCSKCGGTGKEGGSKQDDGEDEGSGGCEQQAGGDGDDNDEGGDGADGGSKPCPQCGGSGLDGSHGTTLDTHVLEVGSEAQSEAQWRRAVQSAKDAAKAMGQMPQHLERFVDQLLEAKVPWEDKLRKSMAKKIGRDTTNWNRPHRRRFITQGIIMPTYNGYGAGTIVFAVDTSGSMSDKELAQALGECDKILTDCNPEKVYLIGCDAAVETVHELGDGDSLVNNIPRIGGGGGTSFIPPFEWCKEEGVNPDTLVYFTDTGGTFPREEPSFPTIWVCSQRWNEPPFGEVIHMEDES